MRSDPSLRSTNAYVDEVFGPTDPLLRSLMKRAVEAGLPDIAVRPGAGRTLMLLARLTRAQLAIEVGTLAGYSGIWIARGLAPGGRLITIEPEQKHARFAQRSFEDAGVADRVEVRLDKGIPALTSLRGSLGENSVDLLFVDAIKTEYEQYLSIARPMIRAGGLVIADNALGSNAWWITDPRGSDESRDAVDRFNRLLAADEAFEAVALPIGQGLLVARRVDASNDSARNF